MKRILWTILTVGLTLGSVEAKEAVRTLVMVPRTEPMLRLGTDLANRQETLLISYLVGANQAVSLHGWTGSEWVNVSLPKFRSGDFFRSGPDLGVVIEEAGKPIPPAALPSPSWCPTAYKITTTEIRPLLHLTGRVCDFSSKDWKWFAKRYDLELDAINPEGLNMAWYQRRGIDHLREPPVSGTSDLQHLLLIHRPVVQVPVEESEAPVAAPEAVDNPLTNEVPDAVIMAPEEADTEVVSDSVTNGAPAEAEADKPAEPDEEAPAVEETVATDSEVSSNEVEKVETESVSTEG